MIARCAKVDPETIEAAMALAEQCFPILAGHSSTPEVVGGALAELVARFVAGHRPELRDKSLTMLVDCVKGLVPILIDEMIADGRAPEDWRKPVKQ